MVHTGVASTRLFFLAPLAVAVSVVFLTEVHAAVAATPAQQLVLYDLASADRHDLQTVPGRNQAWAEVHLVSALQGIVNRREPRLYVFYVTDDARQPGKIDRFWFERMREPGGWLAARATNGVTTLEELVRVFAQEIRGVALYDLNVPATSNVASTAAGCEDLLPIPYDPAPGSVYDRLIANGPRLPVKLRLIREDGSPLFSGAETGSAKCDAYLWAKRRYLDTGRCDPTALAYYLDAWWLKKPGIAAPNCHGLSNHDYFVSRRAFFFDLSPWEDELPQDDSTQTVGTDHRTLVAILRSAWERTRGRRMIHVGGFVPWAWKYTQTAGGKHGDVASEWHYAAILSCFNAYMDADALGLNAMANASVFRHFPLQKKYPQRKPTPADWRRAGLLDERGRVTPRTYVSFYVGDYDSAAWLYQRLPALWNDPARGSIPLGWAFNPNLADRFAPGMDWARRTASTNDLFLAGDSGAGYLNPGNLDGERPFSRLPAGLKTWADHCRRYYSQWDISLTGFVIDGDAAAMSLATLRSYAAFSPDGIVAQKLPARQGLVPATLAPYLIMGSDMAGGDQLEEALRRIQASRANDRGAGPHFHIFRTILWSPGEHRRLIADLERTGEVKVVDPYTLLGLLREHLRQR